MHPLAVVYVFGSCSSLIDAVAHALAGKTLGAEIEEICLFGGPTIARIHVGGIPCVVKLVPLLGGHVKFRTKQIDEFSKGFDDLHRLRRVMIVAAGTAAVAVVALTCLGPIDGMRSIWHGFREVVRGGLHPLSIGTSLVRSLLKLIQARPYTTGLGIVAAKMAAFNLLPLLPLDGGQILWTLAAWRARFFERIYLGAAYVGYVATLILTCGWLLAIGDVLFFG